MESLKGVTQTMWLGCLGFLYNGSYNSALGKALGKSANHSDLVFVVRVALGQPSNCSSELELVSRLLASPY